MVLKFKTDKAADVGRLIGGLGRLGRHMAALPGSTEGERAHSQAIWLRLTDFNIDAVLEDAAQAPEPTTAGPSKNAQAAPSTDSKPQQGPAGSGSGGGGKKKKKGKK